MRTFLIMAAALAFGLFGASPALAAGNGDGRTDLQRRLGKGGPRIVSAMGPNGASAATADHSVVCAGYLSRTEIIDLTVKANIGVYLIYKSGVAKLTGKEAKVAWCDTTKPSSNTCVFLFGDQDGIYGDTEKCN